MEMERDDDMDMIDDRMQRESLTMDVSMDMHQQSQLQESYACSPIPSLNHHEIGGGGKNRSQLRNKLHRRTLRDNQTERDKHAYGQGEDKQKRAKSWSRRK